MKGFTLIELLIVIAILAILTTAVVLVLNPAQMLAEARDSQRLADMDSVRSAINLFLTTATDTSSFTANVGPWSTGTTTCGFTTACTVRTVYTVGGAGWVGVDFSKTSGGSPLSVLPRDPTNDAIYSYNYKGSASALTFDLHAKMESAKYQSKMLNDGGSSNSWYEVGTDVNL